MYVQCWAPWNPASCKVGPPLLRQPCLSSIDKDCQCALNLASVDLTYIWGLPIIKKLYLGWACNKNAIKSKLPDLAIRDANDPSFFSTIAQFVGLKSETKPHPSNASDHLPARAAVKVIHWMHICEARVRCIAPLDSFMRLNKATGR